LTAPAAFDRAPWWARLWGALRYLLAPGELESGAPGWRFLEGVCLECGDGPKACAVWGDETRFRFCEPCLARVLNTMAVWYYRRTTPPTKRPTKRERNP
jgi:hypothetical protein